MVISILWREPESTGTYGVVDKDPAQVLSLSYNSLLDGDSSAFYSFMPMSFGKQGGDRWSYRTDEEMSTRGNGDHPEDIYRINDQNSNRESWNDDRSFLPFSSKHWFEYLSSTGGQLSYIAKIIAWTTTSTPMGFRQTLGTDLTSWWTLWVDSKSYFFSTNMLKETSDIDLAIKYRRVVKTKQIIRWDHLSGLCLSVYPYCLHVLFLSVLMLFNMTNVW
jgi:hypothetical protein